jgi:glycine betaine/proline transport system substrate-binding protein
MVSKWRPRAWSRKGVIAVSALVAVSSLAIAGVSAGSTGSAKPDSKGTVTLIDEDWTSQQANTRVAAAVLKKMGYDAKLRTMTLIGVFPSLAKGDTDINVEVWDATSLKEFKKYVATGKVKDLGALPIHAEEGWYVPTYVIKGDPKRGIKPTCPGLPNWKALNKCAKIFATPESGSQGRYLSGAPGWAQFYGDDQRIENLKLNYKMMFGGSEVGLVTELRKAYQAGKPVLHLMWRPHWFSSKYDMTLVQFPPYTPKCWGTTYACQWAPIHLKKLVRPDLAQDMPEVAAFVKNFGLSDKQLGTILQAVDEKGVDLDVAVQQWMDKNQSVWQKWIPKNS